MAQLVEHMYQFKRGTADRWKELNLILGEGEPGFETDTGRLKIGNGKTRWNALPYITDVKEIVFDEELAEVIENTKKEIINNLPVLEIDTDLSENSRNPIQNSTVTKKFIDIEKIIYDDKQDIANINNSLQEQAQQLNNFNIINAKDFGAFGDGKSHTVEQVYGSVELAKADYPDAENLYDEIDGLAIQKAVDIADSLKIPLYIPAGTYLISKTIEVHRKGDADKKVRINFYGSGMSTVLQTTETFEGNYVLNFNTPYAQPCMVWVHDFSIILKADVSGIYFHKLGMKAIVENIWVTFDYPKLAEDTNYKYGIYCDSSTVATFQRIKIMGNVSNFPKGEGLGKGPRNVGMCLAETHSVKVIDCDIIFCRWGLYLNSGSHVSVENCRIDENDFGIYQNGRYINADYMINTRAETNFKGTLNILTIRQNRFEGNNQYSIFLAAYSTSRDTFNQGVVISENYFDHLGHNKAMHTSRQVFRKAIHLHGNRSVIIQNNTFKGKEYTDSTEILNGSTLAEEKTLVEHSVEQNLSGSRTYLLGTTHKPDYSIRGNMFITWANGKTTNSQGQSVTKLEYSHTKIGSKILSETGLVDNMEIDQSTRSI